MNGDQPRASVNVIIGRRGCWHDLLFLRSLIKGHPMEYPIRIVTAHPIYYQRKSIPVPSRQLIEQCYNHFCEHVESLNGFTPRVYPHDIAGEFYWLYSKAILIDYFHHTTGAEGHLIEEIIARKSTDSELYLLVPDRAGDYEWIREKYNIKSVVEHVEQPSTLEPGIMRYCQIEITSIVNTHDKYRLPHNPLMIEEKQTENSRRITIIDGKKGCWRNAGFIQSLLELDSPIETDRYETIVLTDHPDKYFLPPLTNLRTLEKEKEFRDVVDDKTLNRLVQVQLKNCGRYIPITDLLNRGRHVMIIDFLPSANENVLGYIKRIIRLDKDLRVFIIAPNYNWHYLDDTIGQAGYIVRYRDFRKYTNMKNLLWHPTLHIISLIGYNTPKRSNPLKIDLNELVDDDVSEARKQYIRNRLIREAREAANTKEQIAAGQRVRDARNRIVGHRTPEQAATMKEIKFELPKKILERLSKKDIRNLTEEDKALRWEMEINSGQQQLHLMLQGFRG